MTATNKRQDDEEEQQRGGGKEEDEEGRPVTAARAAARQIKALLLEQEPTRRDDRADAARLDELRRLLANNLWQDEQQQQQQQQQVDEDTTPSLAVQKWRRFLQKSQDELVRQLTHRIVVDGKLTAIRTLWGVVVVVAAAARSAPLCRRQGGSSFVDVPTALLLLLRQWLWAMARIPVWDASVQRMVQGEILGKKTNHRDVQYFIMIAIQQVADDAYAALRRQRRRRHNDDDGQESHEGNSSRNKDDKRKGGEDPEDDERSSSSSAAEEEAEEENTQLVAERLVQLLSLIPFAKSQKELDDSPSFLFSPPPPRQEDNNTIASSDNDDDDDDRSDDEDGVDDSSADESSSDDDDDKKRPGKRAKPPQPKSKRRRRPAIQDWRSHRRVWSKAWLAVLRLELPVASLKRALKFLPVHVLPHVANPLRFAGMFMTAYETSSSSSSSLPLSTNNKNTATSRTMDKKNANNNNNNESICHHHNSHQHHHAAAVISILALEGLFYLMIHHGLEYPKYYQQLYTLVTPSLFYIKHCTQFVRLLENSLLRNQLLPAHVTAAFAKRLAQCCLQIPPASCLTALALLSNLLRTHPETASLIHRQKSSKNDNHNDECFDAHANDPAQTRALQSSLWELGALSRHYHPAVVTLAESIGREHHESTPLHVLDDFTSLSYKSLFEQERKKRPNASLAAGNNNKRQRTSNNNNKQRSRKTPLTFQAPTAGLFAPTDVFAGILALPSSSNGSGGEKIDDSLSRT